MNYKTFKKLNNDLSMLLEVEQPLTKHVIKRIFYHPDLTIDKLRTLPVEIQNEIRVFIITRKPLNTRHNDFVSEIELASFVREHYLVQKILCR